MHDYCSMQPFRATLMLCHPAQKLATAHIFVCVYVVCVVYGHCHVCCGCGSDPAVHVRIVCHCVDVLLCQQCAGHVDHIINCVYFCYAIQYRVYQWFHVSAGDWGQGESRRQSQMMVPVYGSTNSVVWLRPITASRS